MKYTEHEAEVFNKMLHDYLSIDCDTDLESRGLEYKEYHYMGFTVDCLRYNKQCFIDSKGMADYFESFGMVVENSDSGYTVFL